MIIVDRALRKLQDEGRSIKVAMIGAGFMGRGIARQLCNVTPGIELVAVWSRSTENALAALHVAGVEDPVRANTDSELQDAIARRVPAVCEDPMLACTAEGVDVVLEVTGTVEFGAKIVLAAIEHGKHVVMMNAELDGTLGPILKVYADRQGVVLTNADGDQPGVQMNLSRFVQGIGGQPLLSGNIKGLHDPYRNPTTQQGFAERWQQNVNMVTSFADGTKISFEQAIVANATGMTIARRGMMGPEVKPGTHVKEAVGEFADYLQQFEQGVVDYVVGAEPAPGVFVVARFDDPVDQHYLELYKLGVGPMYCFYTPFHLCHFEVPNSIARAALFGDATITPLAGPLVEVVATAKRSLTAGDRLDQMGGFMTYGQCERTNIARIERLLPMGLAENCCLRRGVDKDQVITLDDVEFPAQRLSDRLWSEQDRHFNGEASNVN